MTRKLSPSGRRRSHPKKETIRGGKREALLRAHLAKALGWADAHADFDRAVNGLPRDLRGRQPEGLPYSAWQLLEHLRRTQRDILDFCLDPAYRELNWPDDYWPATKEPPTEDAWDESVGKFRRDQNALRRLATDSRLDLFSTIPHGSGQTYLRELLLVIDHNSYHVGELVALRRLLGAWTK